MAMATDITAAYAAERARLHELRLSIETGLQAMVDLLDMLDAPDEDREEGDPAEEDDHPEDDDPDERTAPERHGGAFVMCAADDHEPSLGSMGSSGHWPQTAWAMGGSDDREQDAGDEGEPDEDGEPANGATHDPDQEVAWASPQGWGYSAEDSGIGDEDALAEMQGEIALGNVPYDAARSAALSKAGREAREALATMTGTRSPCRREHRDVILVAGLDNEVYGLERLR